MSSRPRATHLSALAAALVAVFGAPCSARAQSASVLLGALHPFGPAETESFTAVAVRVDHAVQRWLLAELGAEYAAVERRRADGPRRGGTGRRLVTHYAAPRRSADLQLQVQYPGASLRPFIGAGLGAAVWRALPDSAGIRKRVDGPSYSFAAGLRLDLARHLGARVEVRGFHDEAGVGFGDGAWSVRPAVGAAWRW